MATRRVLLAVVVCGIVEMLALAALGQEPVPQVPAKGTLKVTVEYKGAGKVDKDHQIWIWVFDTPTIDGSSMPIAANSLSENGAAVTFASLPETVYIAVAFDEKGGYDGTTGPPPSGTPVMIYGDAGVARAIKTGGDAAVQITFDDSVRMP